MAGDQVPNEDRRENEEEEEEEEAGEAIPNLCP